MPVVRLRTYQANSVASALPSVPQITAPVQGVTALARFADAAGQWADQKAVEWDETTAKDLVNQADQKYTSVKFGGEGVQGLYTMEGNTFLKALPDARKRLDEIDAQTLALTDNPRQKELVRQSLAARRQTTEVDLSRLEAGEFKKYKDETDTAQMLSVFNQAALAPTPEERNARLTDGRVAAYQFFTVNKGMSHEGALVEVRKVMTQAHHTVISGMLAKQDYQGALNYLNAYSYEMEPGYVAKAKTDLGEMARIGQSQVLADSIVSKVQANPSYDYTQDVRSIKDPNLRDDVDQRVQRGVAVVARQADTTRSNQWLSIKAKVFKGEPISPQEEQFANTYYPGELTKERNEAAQGRYAPEGGDDYMRVALRTDQEIINLGRAGIDSLIRDGGYQINPKDLQKLYQRADGLQDVHAEKLAQQTNAATADALKLIEVYKPGMKPKDRDKIEGNVKLWVAREIQAQAASGKTLTPADLLDISKRAAGQGGGDEPFATSEAGKLYSENRDLYGGVLFRMSGAGLPGARREVDRDEAEKAVRNIMAGKPAATYEKIPPWFLNALSEDYQPLTKPEAVSAYTEWLRSGNVDTLFANRRKGRSSPAHNGRGRP